MKTERTNRKASQPGSPGPSYTSPLRLMALLCLLGGLFSGVQLQAADKYPPNRLTYQGFLVDANGIPLATNAPKNYDVIFAIWDDESAGTAPLWMEQQTVTVDGGNFSVLLGEGSQVGTNAHGALSSLFVGPTASDRFVEMTVKGIGSSGEDVILAPRLRLLATPYSLVARSAHALVGDNGSNVVATSGNNSLVVAGSVTATNFAGPHTGNGAALTNLNANNISSGSIPDARLTTNVPLKNAANTFSAGQTLIGNVGIGAANTAGSKLQVTGGGGTTIDLIVNGRMHSTSGDGGLWVGSNRFLGAHSGDKVGIWNNGSWHFNVQPNGHVGIGTHTPTQAKLVVLGGPSGVDAGDNGFFYDSPLGPVYDGQYVKAISSGTGSDVATAWIDLPNLGLNKFYWVGQCSIYADRSIWSGTQLITSSDERIKDIKGRSDSVLDLNTLMGIEITDYRYKDSAKNGGVLNKKVIAQQVEKVFPQAVSKQTDVIPDILKQASIKDGWVMLPTTLKKGDRVKLVEGKDREAVHEVLEVAMHGFRTDLKTDAKTIFVYGREVNDFRTVDYDAIAMLNVSATQELAKEVAALHKSAERLAELEQKLVKMEQLEKQVARMGDLERELADLKSMIGKLGVPQEAGPAAVTEPSESTTQSPR